MSKEGLGTKTFKMSNQIGGLKFAVQKRSFKNLSLKISTWLVQGKILSDYDEI